MFERKMPAKVQAADDEGHDMTGVNGAPGAMDEDGELDTSVGDKPDAVEEDDEGPAEDVSPVVQNLKVDVVHPPGGVLMTLISAQVHTAQGIQPKRTSIPGHVTIVRLATILDSIDSW